MRYIDTSSINVPINWIEIAKKKFGNSYPSLWSYFKEDMKKIVGKKCWYSESKNEGSDNNIDHFRPKAELIKELTSDNATLEDIVWNQLDNCKRKGYSFLEFEFSNFRYSCTYVNSLREGEDKQSKGKSNFFPLKKSNRPATSLNELPYEQPALIDPCSRNDVEMFTFNSLGYIEPHISILKTSWEYCRVKVSIEVYHLHHSDFYNARIELWKLIQKKIEFATRLWEKNPRTYLEQESFTEKIKEIFKAIQKTSEFSAVAIDCIRFYKKTYTWLGKFFPDSKLKK
jgi:hypothetical protein